MTLEELNQLKDFSKRNNLDYRILRAILLKESNARGFNQDGTIKKRFEKHIFNSFLAQKQHDKKNKFLPGLSNAWIGIHTEGELRDMATSWGIAQIMGWQYNLLGFGNIGEMIQNYNQNQMNQILSFLIFCERYREGQLLKAIQERDYPRIALLYNGAGYKENNYDVDLERFTYNFS